MWSLDEVPLEASTLADLRERQRITCGSVIHLLQVLAGAGGEIPPVVRLVTRGAVATGAPSSLSSPASSTLWGMGRVITLEHPEFKCLRIDLDPHGRDEGREDLTGLLDEILFSDGEDQVAYRGAERLAARLSNRRIGDAAVTPVPADDVPFRLRIPDTGLLEDLTFEPAPRIKPGPDEVEIRVKAVGLNFKDVMGALRMYPGDAGPPGKECSGVVMAVGEGVESLRIGDEVIALASGCFGDSVRAAAGLVTRKPPHFTFEEAAAVPVNFMTARYALETVGRLSAGERVLIHAGAGGVGLAAVQLAQRIGADVFATAGSEAKRDYLKTLGVKHVMDSRSLEFSDQVMKITGNEGVDVVLNSLAGEAVIRGLSVLRKGGRFIELGKAEVLREDQRDRLADGVLYFPIDLGEEAEREPAAFGSMLADLTGELARGELKFPPARVFSFENVIDAFRLMKDAGHIGKIVIARDGDALSVSMDPAATYLITGGLGGLGLLFAGWMVGRGARHIVLMGRSAPSAGAQDAVESLRAEGAEVVVEQGNVSDPEDVSRIIGKIQSSPFQLRGVLHGAGLLDDGVLLQQTWDKFETVFAPKVYGGYNLHRSTQDVPLDFFVLFSSAAALLGMPGQANHSAANAFLDALAHYRRAQGLEATSINWGAWSQVGSATDAHTVEHVRSHGLDFMTPEEGLGLFEEVLKDDAPQIGVVPMRLPTFLRLFASGALPPFLSDLATEENDGDRRPPHEMRIMDRLERTPPSQRRRLLLESVTEQVRLRLGLDDAAPVDPQLPLVDLGMDSLLAIELRNRLSSGLGLEQSLPVSLLYDYPSVGAITDFLLENVLFPGAEKTGTGRTGKPDRDFTAIRDLSEEEAEALLLKELAGEERDGRDE